jgi:hypothetical protein
MEKKKKVLKARIPLELVFAIRKGGAFLDKRKYKRKRDKKIKSEELD